MSDSLVNDGNSNSQYKHFAPKQQLSFIWNVAIKPTCAAGLKISTLRESQSSVLLSMCYMAAQPTQWHAL